MSRIGDALKRSGAPDVTTGLDALFTTATLDPVTGVTTVAPPLSLGEAHEPAAAGPGEGSAAVGAAVAARGAARAGCRGSHPVAQRRGAARAARPLGCTRDGGEGRIRKAGREPVALRVRGGAVPPACGHPAPH